MCCSCAHARCMSGWKTSCDTNASLFDAGGQLGRRPRLLLGPDRRGSPWALPRDRLVLLFFPLLSSPLVFTFYSLPFRPAPRTCISRAARPTVSCSKLSTFKCSFLHPPTLPPHLASPESLGSGRGGALRCVTVAICRQASCVSYLIRSYLRSYCRSRLYFCLPFREEIGCDQIGWLKYSRIKSCCNLPQKERARRSLVVSPSLRIGLFGLLFCVDILRRTRIAQRSFAPPLRARRAGRLQYRAFLPGHWC